MRMTLKNRVSGLTDSVTFFFFCFTYAIFIAVAMQKIIIPMIPAIHASNGLLQGDAVTFHQIATDLANRILINGWSEWSLLPGNGLTANVGILSIVYVLLGPNPVWFIPLNAIFHALGATLIFGIGRFLLVEGGKTAGMIAGTIFLMSPSSLVWVSQNHKDAFLIVGFLLLLVSFIKIFDNPSCKSRVVLAMVTALGSLLVIIMRPHMMLVYTVVFGAAFFLVISCISIKGALKVRTIFSGLFLLAIMAVFSLIAPKSSELADISAHSRLTLTSELIGWSWQSTEWLPDFIDRTLERVSFIRKHLSSYGMASGANTMIDSEINPVSFSGAIAYLPRALWVGMLAPFPKTWQTLDTLPALVSAVEMLVFYLMLPGILILIRYKSSPGLFVCLIVAASVIVVLSYTSPNLGTLHRIRYGPMFVLMVAGICGWTLLFVKARCQFARLLGAAKLSNEHLSQLEVPYLKQRLHLRQPFSVNGSSPSRSLGGIFFIFSLVGMLAFLIRDLLLFSALGLDTRFDIYFLIMLIPMVCVTVFSQPLQDLIVNAILATRDCHAATQDLISVTNGISLLFTFSLSIFLFVFSDTIYRVYLDMDMRDIFPFQYLAISLFLFSGLVILGNSILIAVGYEKYVAAFQLLVPLTALIAIFGGDSHLIERAIGGMILGQILNLGALAIMTRSKGYSIFQFRLGLPTYIRPLLRDYFYLVTAAIFLGLSIPLNYWLSSRIGEGYIATWALGTKLSLGLMALFTASASAILVPYMASLFHGSRRSLLNRKFWPVLIACNWGAGAVAIVVSIFVRPLTGLLMPGEFEHGWLLASVVMFTTLQLPILVTSMILQRLAVISQDVLRVATISGFGLAVNALLGYTLLDQWGLLGVAAATGISGMLSSIFLLLATRTQTGLGYGQMVGLALTWLAIASLAVSLHFNDLSVAVVAGFGCAALVIFQIINIFDKVAMEDTDNVLASQAS